MIDRHRTLVDCEFPEVVLGTIYSTINLTGTTVSKGKSDLAVAW